MREKSMRFIVTFRTTVGAMAMEKACKEENVPGRLIPVPRAISAGCGMCWMAPPEDKALVEGTARNHQLDVDGTYELML